MSLFNDSIDFFVLVACSKSEKSTVPVTNSAQVRSVSEQGTNLLLTPLQPHSKAKMNKIATFSQYSVLLLLRYFKMHYITIIISNILGQLAN